MYSFFFLKCTPPNCVGFGPQEVSLCPCLTEVIPQMPVRGQEVVWPFRDSQCPSERALLPAERAEPLSSHRGLRLGSTSPRFSKRS